ncbi:unnamed protein product [Cylindrotheca closterium]|uniref:Orc1-like AAA ATPase domain-containing protein n=1 Tax=Cylindrotheca closterium TaxID=2856 RepID=A0AAD2G6S4_9STRA|nr:unnamed protein product [Cylindrotheca closterium]
MSVRSSSGKPQSYSLRRGSALANTVISEDEVLSKSGTSEDDAGFTFKSSDFSVSSRDTLNNSREFSWRLEGGSGDLSAAFSVGSAASLRSKNTREDELNIIDGSRRKPQHHQTISEFTIDKLKVDSIGLIGREKEVASLATCFERLMSKDFHDAPMSSMMSTRSFTSTECSTPLILDQPKKELVYISGLSGVGKSSVARTLKRDMEKMDDAIYVEGKFDFNTSNEPYSGIAKALGSICRIILETRQEITIEIATEIYDALHDEIGVLVAMIPDLKEIVGSKYKVQPNTTKENEEYNFANGKQSLKYAFRVLMRVLSSHISVLVMMLDDLQWADPSSLEVIDYIITDIHNPRPLMILGCYRSDEFEEDSLLAKDIQRLKKKAAYFLFAITEIEVNAFDVDDVNRIIMAMMSIDDPNLTLELARLCHQRTLGNPFFLIEFMMMLHSETLIEFNLGLLKWVYDVSKIEDATMSTTNVANLLEVRMKQLPKKIQLFLQYAACLGSSFSESTLQLIWDKRVEGEGEESIQPLLENVTSHHIVDHAGQGRYRWVHDKVQEAALALTGGERESFQFSVGASLYHWLSKEELENELFEVTDLINSYNTRNHYEYAELNLQAAEKARGIFALHSASEYAAIGIGMLPEVTYEERPGLALRLYIIGAEMELALGHGDAAEAYRNALVSRSEYSLVDTLPLQCAYVRKLSFVDLDYPKAVEVCIDILSKLGVQVLWRRVPVSIQALTILMRTISKANKEAPHPANIFKEMELMTDKRDQLVMDLLSTMGFAAYHIRGSLLSVVGICMMVQMTLERGIAKESGNSFVWLGNFTISLKSDYQTAAKFADIGLAIQKGSPPAREGACLFNSHAFVLSWKLPFHECLKPLADGYASSMKMGDTAYAMWALVSRHVWVPYLMGKPLEPLLREFPLLQSQMEELSQGKQLISLKSFRDLFLNLVISGVDVDGPPEISNKAHFARGEMLLFFDPEAAAKRALKVGNNFAKHNMGTCLIMIETFHRGVSLYSMARRTGQRKYRNPAGKIRKLVQSWWDAGNPNVKHYIKLLDAEEKALGKSYDKAEKLYVEAIALAARTGHLHHAALFNERYADLLMHHRRDKKEAEFRLTESIRYYKEWGAIRKVEAVAELLMEQMEGGDAKA